MWLTMIALFAGAMLGALTVALCAARRISELEWRLYRLHRRAERYRALAAARGDKIDRLCDEIIRLSGAGQVQPSPVAEQVA